jgi:mRNA interferase MazF
MRRGDLVTVAPRGEQGKPRPAVIVQADQFSELLAVVVLPVTSTSIEAPLLRIPVEPTAQNGLTRRSHIMIDKPRTAPRRKLGSVIGCLDNETMLSVNRALSLLLALPGPGRPPLTP